MWLWLIPMAFADVIVLDNGSEVRGGLVSWKEDGGCVLRLDDGALAGVIVQLPCERIKAFSREERTTGSAADPSTPRPTADAVVVAEEPKEDAKTKSSWVDALREEWTAVKTDLKPKSDEDAP